MAQAETAAGESGVGSARERRARARRRARRVLGTVSGVFFATGVLLSGLGLLPALGGAALAGLAAYVFERRAGARAAA